MCCCKFSSAEPGGKLETFWVSTGSGSRHDDEEEEEEELWCDDFMLTVSFFESFIVVNGESLSFFAS